MLSGDFAKKIKALNKRFVIRCNDNPKFPAALYYVLDNDEVHICGVDRNEVPEHTHFEGRFIAKGGWRRVLKILVKKDLVDRRAVKKEFGTDLSYGDKVHNYRWEDPIEKALKEARAHAKDKAQRKIKGELADKQDGKDVNYFELDDLLQIHRMRQKQKGEI